jgi:hypothetical protein
MRVPPFSWVSVTSFREVFPSPSTFVTWSLIYISVRYVVCPWTFRLIPFAYVILLLNSIINIFGNISRMIAVANDDGNHTLAVFLWVFHVYWRVDYIVGFNDCLLVQWPGKPNVWPGCDGFKPWTECVIFPLARNLRLLFSGQLSSYFFFLRGGWIIPAWDRGYVWPIE